MLTLRHHLWKEWRDQRAALVGLLLVLPLMPLAAWAGGRGDLLDTTLIRGIGAGAGALAALLVVGTHLIPSELDGRGLLFLERQPAGLHRAFAAKLVLYFGTAIGFALYGFLLAEGTLELRDYPTHSFPIDRWNGLTYVLPSLTLAAWIFAATPWVPKGPLAIPLGLACAALFGWPGVWFFDSPDWFHPARWEVVAYFAFGIVGASLSAWVAFARGLRCGGSRGRAAFWGVLVATACASPTWAWAAHRWHRAHFLELDDPRLQVSGAVLDESGSSLLVHANAGSSRSDLGLPSGAFLIDLETLRTTRLDRDENGLPIAPDDWKPALETTDDPDIELPAGARFYQWPNGFGRVVRGAEGGQVAFWDPFRESLYPNTVVEPWQSPRYSVGISTLPLLVVPDGWIVRSRAEPTGWQWVDPTTLEGTPFAWLGADENVAALLDDGSLLVHDEGSVRHVDPRTGESRDITPLRRGIGSPPVRSYHTWPQWTPLPTDRTSILWSTSRPFLYDPLRGELIDFAPPDSRFEARIDEHHFVLRLGRSQLVRVDARDASMELLFPTSESD